MTHAIYWDTSALIKLYAPEPDSSDAVSPQQGIVVRELSVHEVADQFEIRAALETFVVRAIAGKITAEQASQLGRNLDEHQQAAHAGAVDRCVALDSEFHRLLCKFHGNREVVLVMERLREKMHRLMARVFANDQGRLTESVAEHAAVAQAVLDGEPQT